MHIKNYQTAVRSKVEKVICWTQKTGLICQHVNLDVSWCLVFRCLHWKQGTQPEQALQKRKQSHWEVKKKRHYNNFCIGAAFRRWKTSVSGQLNTKICQECIKWENCEPILHQYGCIWHLRFCGNKITLSTCKKQKRKLPVTLYLILQEPQRCELPVLAVW